MSILQPTLPRGLVIETYRGCNFRCSHCNVPVASKSSAGPMSQSIFEALSPILSVVDEVGYDNFGEPTMNPLLVEFIRCQKDLNCRSRARFNSNMSLISEDYACQLLEAGLDELQASIDAASVSLFSAIRVGGELSGTLQRIKMLAKLAATLKPGTFSLSACFVAHSQNIQELPVVARRLASIGITALYVNGLEPYRLEYSAKVLWRRKESRQVAYEIFQETRKWASAHNFKLYLPSLLPKTNAVCLLPQNTMTVSFDGEVSPCFLLAMESPIFPLSGRLLIRPRVIFGNVASSSPLDIWTSVPYVQFRTSAAKQGGGDLATCHLCLQRQGLICMSATGAPSIQHFEQNDDRG